MSDTKRVSFNVKLAGKRIQLKVYHSYTKDYCHEYLTDESPDFMITVNQTDIEFERQKSFRENELEGIPARYFSEEYLETLAACRQIAVKMLDYDTLLFHGSCIAVDGVGYLFAAPSGTGKSTHARLWRELFRDRAVMVNDDKPLLKVTDEGVLAYGTPWNGKHRLGTNMTVPLKAICFLERGSENHIEPIDMWTAFPLLYQQSYRPHEQDAMNKTLSLLEKIASGVMFYKLNCNMDPDAAKVAWLGMKGETVI